MRVSLRSHRQLGGNCGLVTTFLGIALYGATKSAFGHGYGADNRSRNVLETNPCCPEQRLSTICAGQEHWSDAVSSRL